VTGDNSGTILEFIKVTDEEEAAMHTVFKVLRRAYQAIEAAVYSTLDIGHIIAEDKGIPLPELANMAKEAVEFADDIYNAAIIIQTVATTEHAYMTAARMVFGPDYKIPSPTINEDKKLSTFAEIEQMFKSDLANKTGREHAKPS